MRYAALAQMRVDHSLGWSNGLHGLKTGDIAFNAAAGMSVWEYYAQHPEVGQVFSQSMTNLGTPISQAVVATYDFSEFNTIVDVGGAQGSLISTIVQSYPHLKGILFDVPEVIANVSVDDNIQKRAVSCGTIQKSTSSSRRKPLWVRWDSRMILAARSHPCSLKKTDG